MAFLRTIYNYIYTLYLTSCEHVEKKCFLISCRKQKNFRYNQLLGISLLHCTNYQYIFLLVQTSCQQSMSTLYYSNFLCFCRETEGHLLGCLQAQSIFLLILLTKCLLIWTWRFWYSEMVQSVLASKRPQKPQLHLITTA